MLSIMPGNSLNAKTGAAFSEIPKPATRPRHTAPPRPYSHGFVRHLAELVRAGAPGRRFRRNLRGLADLSERRTARALQRLEGPRKNRIRGPVDARGRHHEAGCPPWPPHVGSQPPPQNARPALRVYAVKLYAEDFPGTFTTPICAPSFSKGETSGSVDSAARAMRRLHRSALIAAIVQWTGQHVNTPSTCCVAS